MAENKGGGKGGKSELLLKIQEVSRGQMRVAPVEKENKSGEKIENYSVAAAAGM